MRAWVPSLREDASLPVHLDWRPDTLPGLREVDLVRADPGNGVYTGVTSAVPTCEGDARWTGNELSVRPIGGMARVGGSILADGRV